MENHEVNREKLKRFLTELLLTGDWSEEYYNIEPLGVSYWRHRYNQGFFISDNKGKWELTDKGHRWLDEQRRS
jgi:hypothetical protein